MNSKTKQSSPTQGYSKDLASRIRSVGGDLGARLGAVVSAVPDQPRGPQRLADALGLDKVLTSRLLRAISHAEPAGILHHVPGPDPLRRFLKAARKRDVDLASIELAEAAVDRFERLIQDDVGDRSALTAILSAWSPEARAEFELRRRQSAYKAISQLKGVSVDLDVSAAFLTPSSDGTSIDVVWLVGLLGLTRLRPGVRIKVSSRRIMPAPRRRVSTDLDGVVLEGAAIGRLDDHCIAPPADFTAHRAGDAIHYTLTDQAFGRDSAQDVFLAEVNANEMPRYVNPKLLRKGYAYSDVAVPARRLVFDVFVHKDIYPNREPELLVYDTAIGGIADVNDAERDIDRMETTDGPELLGHGFTRVGLSEASNYSGAVAHVHDRMGWQADDLRGYRVRVDYPLYGAQYTLAFEPPAPISKTS